VQKKINLFVSGTEYHFLMCISLINEYYSGVQYENVMLLGGYRSSQIDVRMLPDNVTPIVLKTFKKAEDILPVLSMLRYNAYDNLFVFHLYRTLEAYIVYKMKKSTVVHLVEDGALFYHKMERRGLVSRLRMTWTIYREMLQMRLRFFKLIFYRFHLWDSADVDVICMTRPDLFVGRSNLKKPIRYIHLFPDQKMISDCERYFNVPIPHLKNCLIYISFKVYSERDADREIKIIDYLFKKSRYNNLFIKLHPAARQFQIDKMKSHYGDSVVLNNLPAELYLAKAVDSDIFSVASTSMFYNNPACKYYSLKLVCQHLGLYAQWKNVQLPSHVTMITDLTPFIEVDSGHDKK
jgi:hypothetical protein